MHVLDGRGAHAATVGEVEEHGVELEAGEGARAARAREAHPIGLRLVARALLLAWCGWKALEAAAAGANP